MSDEGTYGGPTENDSPPRPRAIEEIVRRCEAHGIEIDEYEPDESWEPWSVCIMFPEDVDPATGMTDWEVFIDDGPHAEFALSEPFEAYRRLRSSGRVDADALWSPSLSAMECPLTSGWGQLNWAHDPDIEDNVDTVMRTLGLAPEADEEDAARRENSPPPRRLRMQAEGLPVSIGPCSNAFALWSNATGVPVDESEVRVSRTLTLRVEDAQLPNEEMAADLLERISNAALFELGRVRDVGLVPSRRPIPPTFPLEIGEGREPLREPLIVQREYEAQPMSLYWYAEQATVLPLLQFLAYYQVLEFYFPAYSVSARVDAVRSTLETLAPGGVQESDVEAVLEAAGVTKKRLLPDERKQLMNVLERCVEPNDLQDFLADEEKARFYGSEESLVLSRMGLPIAGKRDGKRKDLRNRAAERIYEIRNRIVHAKEGFDELGPLLPFDPEVGTLKHDTALVRFLAQETLSKSSRPLDGSH